MLIYRWRHLAIFTGLALAMATCPALAQDRIYGICGQDAAMRAIHHYLSLKPFTSETNYMSRAGYMRWLIYKSGGKWVPYRERFLVRKDDSLQRLAKWKREIEAGQFDTVRDLLRHVEAYNPFSEQKRVTPEQEVLISHLKQTPQGRRYFLLALNTLIGQEEKGTIYTVGEMEDLKSIPILRKVKTLATNYYILQELNFALAKSGDKSIAAELWEKREGNLAHQRFTNFLLQSLTHHSFGEISESSEADAIFSKWKTWLSNKPEFGSITQRQN